MSRSCNRGAKIASRSYQVLATALCLLLGGVIAAVVITRSATVYDEGAYPYHGWAMFVHGWRPFADFHMKVLPLVHLLYGLPQALLGPDMLLARYNGDVFHRPDCATGSFAGTSPGRKLGGHRAASTIRLKPRGGRQVLSLTVHGTDSAVFRVSSVLDARPKWPELAVLRCIVSNRCNCVVPP